MGDLRGELDGVSHRIGKGGDKHVWRAKVTWGYSSHPSVKTVAVSSTRQTSVKNSIQAFSVLKYKNHYVYVSMILYQKLYLSELFLSHLVSIIHHENFSMSLNDL